MRKSRYREILCSPRRVADVKDLDTEIGRTVLVRFPTPGGYQHVLLVVHEG